MTLQTILDQDPLATPASLDDLVFYAANQSGTPTDGKFTGSQFAPLLADVASGSQNRVITLADPTDLAELNAITGMSEGDLTVVTNYYNDKVTFIYTDSEWIRKGKIEVDCVVRYNEITQVFEFVDDAQHIPQGVVGLDSDSPYNFTVTYPLSGKIGSANITVDEEFAHRGFFVGASVSNSEIRAEVYKQGFKVRMGWSSGNSEFRIAEDGDNFIKQPYVTATFDAATSYFTFSHPDIAVTRMGARFLKMSYGNSDTAAMYRPVLVSFTDTSSVWKLLDKEGALVTVNSSGYKFDYGDSGSWRVKNDLIGDSGNFWVSAKHQQ